VSHLQTWLITSSCGLSLNERCCFHERPQCRRLAHGKHFSRYVPCSSPGKRGQVGWRKTRRIAWNRPWGAPTRPKPGYLTKGCCVLHVYNFHLYSMHIKHTSKFLLTFLPATPSFSIFLLFHACLLCNSSTGLKSAVYSLFYSFAIQNDAINYRYVKLAYQ